MGEGKPKRPSFRFGLRTMFVVLTLFACWLGYQLNWIRQRHEFLERQRGMFLSADELGNYDVDERFLKHVFGRATQSAPWPLWLLGESGHVEIRIMVFTNEPTHKDFAEYEDCRLGQSLFPESEITWYLLPPPAARARLSGEAGSSR